MTTQQVKSAALSKAASITKQALAEFCHRWKVAELAVFGSILGQDFRPDSDVDLRVTFMPEADCGLFDHVKMQQELKVLLNRDVDLVSRRAVERSKNWIRRKSILSSAQVVYAA